MNIQSYPKRIVIELTCECNLSCLMCPRKYIDEKSGYMHKALWTKLINEIFEYSPDSVIIPFWRGESLLHPDFINFLELALDKPLRIHMSTNGTLINDESSQLLARCEFITFSIHTISGYNNAKEFLSSRRGKAPIIQASFVEGEEAVEEIRLSMINSPDLQGFDSVRIYAEHSKNGVFGSFAKQANVNRVFCPKLQNTLVIAYDGRISRCNHIWETEREVSVNKMSIAEAWDSNSLQRIRKDYPDAKCRPCGQWTGHTCGESWQKVDGKIKHNRYNLGN